MRIFITMLLWGSFSLVALYLGWIGIDRFDLSYTPFSVTLVDKKLVKAHNEDFIQMLPVNGGVLPLTSTTHMPDRYSLTLQDRHGQKTTVSVGRALFMTYHAPMMISYPCAYTRFTQRFVCS